MVNQLYQNIVWTQRANFISVPTDCPQRDERLGWTGDAETFVRAATYNADVAAFFTKWLVDRGRRPAGRRRASPTSRPTLRGPRRAAPPPGPTPARSAPGPSTRSTTTSGSWRSIIDAMVRWVEYCRKHSKGLLRPAAGYGDWLSIKADTPKDVLATAYFAYSTKLTADAARVLGKQDDARKYDELFEQIKAAFNKAYVARRRADQGQHADLLRAGPGFDLLPPEKRAAAVAIPGRRHQVARHAPVDRLRRHEPS